jgi:integrase
MFNLLLGHASVRTTQEIYTHLTPDAEKRAAEKMDEIFGPVAIKSGTDSVNWIVNY